MLANSDLQSCGASPYFSVAVLGAIHEHQPKTALDQKSSYCIARCHRRCRNPWRRTGMFRPLSLSKWVRALSKLVRALSKWVLGWRMERGFLFLQFSSLQILLLSSSLHSSLSTDCPSPSGRPLPPRRTLLSPDGNSAVFREPLVLCPDSLLCSARFCDTNLQYSRLPHADWLSPCRFDSGRIWNTARVCTSCSLRVDACCELVR